MHGTLDIAKYGFIISVQLFYEEVGCIDIVLGYLSLEITSEKLNKKEILFNYWDRFQI